MISTDVIKVVEYTLKLKEDNNQYVYVDYIDDNLFGEGAVICQCSNRRTRFYTKRSFIEHTKRQIHKKWIEKMNNDKHSHYKDYKETLDKLKQERIVNRKLDTENMQLKTKYINIENENKYLQNENYEFKNKIREIENKMYELRNDNYEYKNRIRKLENEISQYKKEKERKENEENKIKENKNRGIKKLLFG